MKKEIPEEVIAAFCNYPPGKFEKIKADIQVHPVAGGLINHTFKITPKNQPDLLIQQINKDVFKTPEFIQENYIRLWKYLKGNAAGISIPSPVFAGEKSFYIDDNNEYWRAFEFINNAVTFPAAGKPAQVEATARIFGKLTAALKDFDVATLQIAIPYFHDLSFRYQQFEESLQGAKTDRKEEAAAFIQQLVKRQHYTAVYEKIKQSGNFPLRVMHHDAKISNVLFDIEGNIICLVDLDTIMPGYFFSDLGDMIRSMAAVSTENDIDFTNIKMIPTHYEAILQGYLTYMHTHLTADEKNNIHYAGLLIIYMQALRFLTDYLNGDIYYQTQYPEHNLNRAKNQLTLLWQLETFLEKNYQFKC